MYSTVGALTRAWRPWHSQGMNPNVLKIVAACVVAVAASLESQHVLPAGAAGGVGGFIAFVVGMFHPQPTAGGK